MILSACSIVDLGVDFGVVFGVIPPLLAAFELPHGIVASLPSLFELRFSLPGVEHSPLWLLVSVDLGVVPPLPAAFELPHSIVHTLHSLFGLRFPVPEVGHTPLRLLVSVDEESQFEPPSFLLQVHQSPC